MRKDIHPAYYPTAKVSCACGAKFVVGSTKPDISVEICDSCHPFYTGKGRFIDVAGRVEKFKARKEKAVKTPNKKKSAKRAEKKSEKKTKK